MIEPIADYAGNLPNARQCRVAFGHFSIQAEIMLVRINLWQAALSQEIMQANCAPAALLRRD